MRPVIALAVLALLAPTCALANVQVVAVQTESLEIVHHAGDLEERLWFGADLYALVIKNTSRSPAANESGVSVQQLVERTSSEGSRPMSGCPALADRVKSWNSFLAAQGQAVRRADSSTQPGSDYEVSYPVSLGGGDAVIQVIDRHDGPVADWAEAALAAARLCKGAVAPARGGPPN